MASHLSVHLSDERRHWRLVFGVDGEVEAGRVVGCRDGCLPMVAAFRAAELEYHGTLARADAHTRGLVPTVAVTMPSGRTLVYLLIAVEPPVTEGPQTTDGASV